MKKFTLSTISTMIVMLIALGSFAAFGATANPSPASPTGYQTMVIPVMGTYSSQSFTPVKFKAPFRYQVLSASATARASDGTNPTLTVDVQTGSTSVFSAPVAVTAGAIADAVLSATPRFTDEGTVSIILAAGGTAPKWSDITVTLVLKRL